MPVVQVSVIVKDTPEGVLPQVIEGRAAFAVCVLEQGDMLIPSFLRAADGPDIVLMLAAAIRHVMDEHGTEAVRDALAQAVSFGEPINGYIPQLPPEESREGG